MSEVASTFDVLALGELNPDFILTGIAAPAPQLGVEQEFAGHQLTLGSSTAIACVLMQRLGVRTAMRAIVGDDDHGRFCRAALDVEGVDVNLVEMRPGEATGLTICLPYPSDRLLLTCKGTMALDPAAGLDAQTLARFRHLHVGSFFLQTALRPRLPALFAQARALGLTTSLDTGWDPDGAWLTDDLGSTLEATSVFLPNWDEFRALTGGDELAPGLQRLLALGVGAIALKRGSAGAVHCDAAGIVERSGYRATAIDTTGAGDAFNAGYLATMLRGGSIVERLDAGNACGALTVAAIGGTGGVHHAVQVAAFQATAER